MMLRFRDVLSAKDREHVHQIFSGDPAEDTPPVQARSKVNQFLWNDTYIAEEAVQAFKEMTQAERERLISELIWRVTCHLDGSITRVPGLRAYPLGKRFSAHPTEQDNRTILCLGVAG